MGFSLLGCGDQTGNSSSKEVTPDVMLVDYFDATVGTDGGDCHSEYVLYTFDATHHRLSVFTQAADEEHETEKVYLVPLEAEKKCFEAIEEAGLKKWADMDDLYPLDGRRTVVKFRSGEEYIRCSTDEMPDGGERALDQVGAVLKSYALDEYFQETHEVTEGE